jgi:myo-inositol-1-phosphate synthase
MNQPVGVLLIGSKGAVSTAVLAAWCARRAGLDVACPLPSEADPLLAGQALAPLEDMVFGGWDPDPRPTSRATAGHGCVPAGLLLDVADALDAIPAYTPVLAAGAEGLTKAEQAARLEADIARFRADAGVERVVVVDLASTEPFLEVGDVHRTLEAFTAGLAGDDPAISPGMIYAWAAIRTGCPFVNFTPSLSSDIPALEALAIERGVPLTGKDGKTGQTLYKTVLAPMLRQRNLRVKGWYSTNILGNNDGVVLEQPENRATKVASKRSGLGHILGYDDFDHQVHIHYYPPRGDFKEAWDVVDFTGWLGIPMQIRVNWQASDSALAAPLVVDLVRWVDWAARRGEAGFLPWLACYFKHPQGTSENDFGRQVELLRAHVAEGDGV